MSTSAPRTPESLAVLLDCLGILPATCSPRGAHSPEAHVIDRRREGWVVFFTERGNESDGMRYMTEAYACVALLNRVTSEDHNFFGLLAGPALPNVAGLRPIYPTAKAAWRDGAL